MQYKKGIFKDSSCSVNCRVNHAVSGVGYTERYIVVKNSWSKLWGANGFMKLARNYHNCGLWRYTSYPTFKSTNWKDTGKDDKKARYGADDEDDNEDYGDEEYDDEDDDEDYDDNKKDDESDDADSTC